MKRLVKGKEKEYVLYDVGSVVIKSPISDRPKDFIIHIFQGMNLMK